MEGKFVSNAYGFFTFHFIHSSYTLNACSAMKGLIPEANKNAWNPWRLPKHLVRNAPIGASRTLYEQPDRFKKLTYIS